jgi:hypothetical protein
LPQTRDGSGIVSRLRIGQEAAATTGGEAGHVEAILDGHGNAEQRWKRWDAGNQSFFRVLGLSACFIG